MNNSVSRLIGDCDLEINDIEAKINNLAPLDSDIKYFTLYAIIKAEGTLEYAARSIVADYFDKFCSPELNEFVNARIRDTSTSVKYEAICKMLKPFGNNWLATFKGKVNLRPDKEQIIQSSNSLVDGRHQFAHGGCPTISFQDVKTYYLNTKLLIQILDETINPI